MIINDSVILAQLRPSTAADKASFTDAASTTACQLSDAWLTWAQMNSDQPQPSHSLIQQGSYPRQTWKLSEQAEQAKHYILIVIMMNMKIFVSLRNKMVNQVAFPKTIFYNHDRRISILTIVKVAHAIANDLKDQPNHKAYSSEACKAIYKQLQEAREIIARLGKLRGIVTKCPYLSLEGGATGGTYYIKLDMNIFSQV